MYIYKLLHNSYSRQCVYRFSSICLSLSFPKYNMRHYYCKHKTYSKLPGISDHEVEVGVLVDGGRDATVVIQELVWSDLTIANTGGCLDRRTWMGHLFVFSWKVLLIRVGNLPWAWLKLFSELPANWTSSWYFQSKTSGEIFDNLTEEFWFKIWWF